MINNYIKTAIRNLLRNKTYSVINIVGFAIGLTVSILLIFYVKHEMSYDNFHEKKERIFRLAFESSDGNQTDKRINTLTVMGPELKHEFPEITDFVRMSVYWGGTLAFDDQAFQEKKIRYADSSFFDVFSFSLIKGNPETVLKGPNKIVLTEKQAIKMFGNTDILGKTINYNNKNNLSISGIVEDLPTTSHIKFSALISFETIYQNMPEYHFGWNGGWAYYTYLLLNQKAPDDGFLTKLDGFFYEKLGKDLEEHGWSISPLIQKMDRIYLHHQAMAREPGSSGNLSNLYVFSLIAMIILVIASINFMNLTTAQSIKRIKEVGIRKVVGAPKNKLIAQFIGESVLITFIAMTLSIILIEVFLPQFNNLLGKDFSVYNSANINILLGVPFLVLLIGILSGTYPAFFISSYKPSQILKGGSFTGKQKHNLQNSLIVAQFVISITLIISSVIIYSQLNYMQNKNLGYNKENLLSISLESDRVIEKSRVLKKELLNLPNIEEVSIADNYPGLGVASNGYVPEGHSEPQIINVLYVDPDYVETLQLEIAEGRDFENDRKSDEQTYLVNEVLVKSLNWKNPIGKTIDRNGPKKIIGVVKDFHFASMHEEIKPLIFTLKEPWAERKALVKMQGNQTKKTLQSIQKKWKEMYGNEPFIYEFVDNTFKQAYKVDIQFSRIVLFFSLLAIFIACLGLFGLTAFSTEQRTKEIGIRKAMGATVFRINSLIIKQYTRWVIAANLIAWPTAWYAMDQWLLKYAYKIDIHVGYFLLAAVIAFVIAFLTVSYQSVRAAKTNPVDSLRYE